MGVMRSTTTSSGTSSPTPRQPATRAPISLPRATSARKASPAATCSTSRRSASRAPWVPFPPPGPPRRSSLMGGSSASQSLLFRDRSLGGRQRLEAAVGDRVAALHGQPVLPVGQPRLGPLDGGELVLEVLRATRVELLLIEVLRAAILGLVAIAGRLRAELGDLPLDPLALGGEELVGAIGVHRATLPVRRSAMDTRGHGLSADH